MSSLSDLPEHNFPKQYMLAFASLPHARVVGPVLAVPDPRSHLVDLRDIANVYAYSTFCEARNYRWNLVTSLVVGSSASAISVEFARRCTFACLALGLFAALTWIPLVGPAAKAAMQPRTLFGTLDTSISTVGAEKRARLSVAMFELDWASIEPQQGIFSDWSIVSLSHTLWKFRAEGMRVTLGLGLEDPP